MSTPTLQFKLTSTDRYAIVDDGPEHFVLKVDSDMSPREALRYEINEIRKRAAAMMRKASFLESALNGSDVH